MGKLLGKVYSSARNIYVPGLYRMPRSYFGHTVPNFCQANPRHTQNPKKKGENGLRSIDYPIYIFGGKINTGVKLEVDM